jgi:hypothetical protein
MKGAKSSVLAVASFLIGAAVWMMPASASANFNAPLVECALVTTPATLSNCGADPLTRGVVSVSDDGDLDLVLVGAGANQTYSVTYFSADGTQSTSITTTLATDGKGNEELRKKLEFRLGEAGVGNFVISRAGQDQYVSGFHVATVHGPSGPDYRVRMVKCSDVNVPGAIAAGCGTDTFKSGSASIDAQDGSVNVQVNGAAANASYAVLLRAVNGSEVAITTLTTNSKGHGNQPQNLFFGAGTTGSGTIVLTRSGADQALGGFDVTQKPRPKPASSSGLVRCLDVNDPGPLSNCGTDPLASGSAMINSAGKLIVNLRGAAASTPYEVFFRPLNSDSSGDVDTGLAIPTNSNGDGHGNKNFAASGKIGAGSFVVEGGGFDQFVTGFAVK